VPLNENDPSVDSRQASPCSSAANPFEEAYFLPMARRFRQQLSLPVILLVHQHPRVHQPGHGGGVRFRGDGQGAAPRARPHRQDA